MPGERTEFLLWEASALKQAGRANGANDFAACILGDQPAVLHRDVAQPGHNTLPGLCKQIYTGVEHGAERKEERSWTCSVRERKVV